MKLRKGFVSNSSSSSFVCDVCGRDESGWDLCLSDAEMYECENGHTFCKDEAIEIEPSLIVKHLKDSGWTFYGDEEDEVEEYESLSDFENLDEFEYSIPECCCPICTFSVYCEGDMRKYLKKKYNVSEDDAFAEIKALNKRRKKLYDSEYVLYVCRVKNTSVDKEFEEMKLLGSYSKLREYLKL